MRRGDEPSGEVEDPSYGFPAGLWRSRTQPAAGPGSDPGLAQPAARTAADLGVRRGPARGAARGHHHRAARLHRLRPAVRPDDPGRRRVAAPPPVRLAHPPVVAVRADRGTACRARVGDHPGGAGQAMVGGAQAVRVAPGPLGGPGAGTAVAAAARRRHPVRDRHRGTEHPVRLPVRFQLLHGALLRRLGVHRRVRGARGPQAATHDHWPAVPLDARRAAHPARVRPARSCPTPTAWSPPTRPRRR